MARRVEELETQLAEAKAENETLKSALVETNEALTLASTESYRELRAKLEAAEAERAQLLAQRQASLDILAEEYPKLGEQWQSCLAFVFGALGANELHENLIAERRAAAATEEPKPLCIHCLKPVHEGDCEPQPHPQGARLGGPALALLTMLVATMRHGARCVPESSNAATALRATADELERLGKNL